MQDSKLVLLLKTLRPEEIHWMAKFVRSPYHNSNELVAGLFDYLRKYHPAFTSPKLSKENAFQHLFPGQSYDDRRLRLLMFRLSDLTEAFLVAQRLKNNRLQYERLLVAELGDRNEYELFARKNERIIEELKQTPYRDDHYYLTLWQLEHGHFFHPQTARLEAPPGHLEAIMQNLDAFFILSKMRYGAELHNRQNILSETHQPAFLRESRELATHHPAFRTDEVFQISRDILSLMEDPQNEAIYRRLEGNVQAGLPRLRRHDQSALLRYLINATIQLYGAGKSSYLQNQFQLYQLGLEYDLFLSDGQLSDTTFLNILVTATVLGELDWVKDFIPQHAVRLPEEAVADAVRLGWAYWRFGRKDFGGSNDLLRQIETTDLPYQLRVKSLSLRNHFELFLRDTTYFDLLMHESKAYEKFLRRDQRLAGARIQAYLQLIHFLRKMAKWCIKPGHSSRKLAQLQAELEETPTVVAREWLREKLAGLQASSRSTRRP